MVKLFNKTTGQLLGRISDDDLQFLIDNLEEEDSVDNDYYINRTIFTFLKEKGMSEALIYMFENNFTKDGELEIKYEKA